MRTKAGCSSRTQSLLSLVAILVLATALHGWGAPGHRTITALAASMLPDDVPQWLRGPEAVAVASYQANEPDRWRGTRLPALAHENSGDHYFDLELLVEYGLTIQTLPRLRYHFVEALVRGDPASATAEGAEDSESGGRIRRGVIRFDAERVGYLPYAIAEHYAKLVSSMNTARIIEQLNDPRRAHQLRAARSNVCYEMGQLSHFVGDASQPLHTTIHHHGWMGDNPQQYTTDRGFHAYIDSGIVAFHGLGAEGLASFRTPPADIQAGEVWEATISLIERSFAKVEPLYQSEQSGDLRREPGRAFIAERMWDSAAVLSGLYYRAWLEAAPKDQQVADFVRYNNLGAEEEWGEQRETDR